MKLKIWLIENRFSIEQFSKELGVGRTYMSRIVNLKKRPGYDLAKKIEDLTRGEISVEYLMSINNKIESKKSLNKND